MTTSASYGYVYKIDIDWTQNCLNDDKKCRHICVCTSLDLGNCYKYIQRIDPSCLLPLALCSSTCYWTLSHNCQVERKSRQLKLAFAERTTYMLQITSTSIPRDYPSKWLSPRSSENMRGSPTYELCLSTSNSGDIEWRENAQRVHRLFIDWQQTLIWNHDAYQPSPKKNKHNRCMSTQEHQLIRPLINACVRYARLVEKLPWTLAYQRICELSQLSCQSVFY